MIEKIIKEIREALEAAERRKEIQHFDDNKNLYELKIALDYIINPPLKTKREI